MVPLEQYNTQSRISLEILKQCSLNLAQERYIIKERKWHLLCRCHDNSYVAGAVLIETKISRFYLKQGSSTPNNLLSRVKTIWEPCVFRAKPSVLLLKVANGGIWFFRERGCNQGCCHGNKLVDVILFLLWCTLLVPSLKTIASIFREIFLIQYFIIYVEQFMTSSLS